MATFDQLTPGGLRVVFVVEDSLPNGRVGPELTPTLWSLIEQGGWHPEGGVSVLASSTYPNHATFATGTDVAEHRIFANDIWDGDSFVCSSTAGPVGETIFDRALAAGVSTAAITGDQTMIGCMGARAADISWPPTETLDNSLERDCLGYLANGAVIDAVASTNALDADIVYVHMNDPDSTLHRYGPEAPETVERIKGVDDDLATLVELLIPRWDDTVLFVVSDHEQETVDTSQPPIDLAAELDRAGMPGNAHNEGAIGIVYDGPGAETIRRLDVISGAIDLDTTATGAITLAWSDPGRVFAKSQNTLAGQHGSPRTTTQVATVSGGHTLVPGLAERLAVGFGSPSGRPHGFHYARVIADLFELPTLP